MDPRHYLTSPEFARLHKNGKAYLEALIGLVEIDIRLGSAEVDAARLAVGEAQKRLTPEQEKEVFEFMDRINRPEVYEAAVMRSVLQQHVQLTIDNGDAWAAQGDNPKGRPCRCAACRTYRAALMVLDLPDHVPDELPEFEPTPGPAEMLLSLEKDVWEDFLEALDLSTVNPSAFARYLSRDRLKAILAKEARKEKKNR